MDKAQALTVLEQEGAAFLALLEPDSFGAEIIGCPGWTVADLARHLGGIHRWARHAILVGPSEEPRGPEAPDAVAAWYERGLDDLVRTLRDHDPADPCWSFGDPPTVGFWLRRQAHETTLHRWDAARSLGRPVTIAESVAADGIDEVLTMFVPRQVRLGRLSPGPEIIDLVCGEGPPRVLSTTPPPPGTAARATVTGSAEAILLLLWKRIALDDPRLQVTGSLPVAATLLARPLTP